MTAELRSKAENPVEQGRPSRLLYGGLRPTPVLRMRQPLLAKELLCGTQPADLSLMIVVLCFPPYFVVLLFWLLHYSEVIYRK